MSFSRSKYEWEARKENALFVGSPQQTSSWMIIAVTYSQAQPSFLARKQSHPDSPCDPFPDTTASSHLRLSAAALELKAAPALWERGNRRRYSQERRV